MATSPHGVQSLATNRRGLAGRAVTTGRAAGRRGGPAGPGPGTAATATPDRRGLAGPARPAGGRLRRRTVAARGAAGHGFGGPAVSAPAAPAAPRRSHAACACGGSWLRPLRAGHPPAPRPCRPGPAGRRLPAPAAPHRCCAGRRRPPQAARFAGPAPVAPAAPRRCRASGAGLGGGRWSLRRLRRRSRLPLIVSCRRTAGGGGRRGAWGGRSASPGRCRSRCGGGVRPGPGPPRTRPSP